MWAVINSNDFGRFGNYSAGSNSNFGVVDIISKTTIDFLRVRGSITYNVTVHIHTNKQHTQYIHNHTSIPTVVVSLMIHENIYVVLYMYMYMCISVYVCAGVSGHMDFWTYGRMDMCMCMCVVLCCLVVCCLVRTRQMVN